MSEFINYFSWQDYALFFLMLIISALIGVYFSFFGKKQDNRDEYIHGGRKMQFIPVALSSIVTEVSAIQLLAIPSEVYLFGSAVWMAGFSIILSSIYITYFILPVLYKVKPNSCFEYLKWRFDNRVCVFLSAVFLATSFIYAPIVIYAAVIAFTQGISFNIAVPVVCIVCIFYTTIGGVKAVVWTDTVQSVAMLGSFLVVIGLGVSLEDSFKNIWEKNIKGERLGYMLYADPTSRTAGLTVAIGLSALYVGYSLNPVKIQRFLSVSTLGNSRKVILLSCCGTVLFNTVFVLTGLIIYSRYQKCDPITAGIVKKSDQVLPYYVMDIAGRIPGLPGIFLSGVLSAALSTMSSLLNTLSGIVYEDFLAAKMPPNISEKRINNIMKIICVIFGIITMIMIFLIQFLGTLFQMAHGLISLSAGPMAAVFSLGMLTTFVNGKGIFWGIICGIVAPSWLLFGSTYYQLTGKLKPPFKPVSVEECPFNVSLPILNITQVTDDNLPPYPFRIAFYYYSWIGVIVTIIVATAISLKTSGRTQTIDRDLLHPVIYPLISNRHKSKLEERQRQEKEKEEEELKSLCKFYHEKTLQAESLLD